MHESNAVSRKLSDVCECSLESSVLFCKSIEREFLR